MEEEDSLITGITVQILIVFEINSGNYTNDLLKFWAVQQKFVLGPQVDSVIEVTGRKSNVTVTFDTQKENGEDGEPKNGTLKISDGKNDLTFFKLCSEGEHCILVVSDNLFCVAGTKRKACSTTEDSPSKKIKVINDGMKMWNTWAYIMLCCVFFNPCFQYLVLGFCIFVGNLNNHKKAEEISNALAQRFMAQSLLVENIRIDRSK